MFDCSQVELIVGKSKITTAARKSAVGAAASMDLGNGTEELASAVKSAAVEASTNLHPAQPAGQLRLRMKIEQFMLQLVCCLFSAWPWCPITHVLVDISMHQTGIFIRSESSGIHSQRTLTKL